MVLHSWTDFSWYIDHALSVMAFPGVVAWTIARTDRAESAPEHAITPALSHQAQVTSPLLSTLDNML